MKNIFNYMYRLSWIHVLSILLVLSYINVTCAYTTGSREDKTFTVAVKAYQDGFLDIALREFDRFIARYPSSSRIPMVFFYMGEIYLQKNRFDKSKEMFKKVMDLGEKSGAYIHKARYRVGEINFRQKKYEEATIIFQHVTDFSTDKKLLAKAYYWLGEIHYKNEEFADAIEKYEESLRLDEKGKYGDYACYSLGWAYYNLSSPSKTLEYFDRLLKNYPRSSLCKSVVGLRRKSLFSLKKYGEVIKLVLKDLDKIPRAEKEEVLIMLAESYYQLREYMRAYNVYKTYLKDYPRGKFREDSVLGEAWSLLKMEKLGESRDRFRYFVKQYPKHPKAPESLFAIASISLKFNDHDGFLSMCEKIMEKYPRSKVAGETLFRVAVFYRNEKYFKKALTAFKKLVENYPESTYKSAASYFIGDCYRELKQFDKAINTFKTIHNNSMDDNQKAQALFQVGSCYYLQGNYLDAKDVFQDILGKYPESSIGDNAKVWLAETLIDLGNLDESKKFYSQLLENADDTLKEEIYYRIPEISFLGGKWEKCIEEYQKFVREFSQSSYLGKAFFRMGIASFNLGDKHSGIGFLQQYLNSSEKKDKEEEAYYRVSRQLYSLGDLEKSRYYCQQYLEKFPQGKYNQETKYQLALTFVGSAYYREAMEILSQTLKEVRNKELKNRILYNLGVCHARLDDVNTAMEMFFKIIKLDKKDEIYYKTLLEIALMQYDRRKYSQSISRLKSIVSSPYPELKSRASFKLAQHHYSIGNERKALIYLKKSIEFSIPGSKINHQAYCQMGEIYENRREWGKAMEAYSYARETAPDKLTRKKFEKKIRQMRDLGALQ